MVAVVIGIWKHFYHCLFPESIFWSVVFISALTMISRLFFLFLFFLFPPPLSKLGQLLLSKNVLWEVHS